MKSKSRSSRSRYWINVRHIHAIKAQWIGSRVTGPEKEVSLFSLPRVTAFTATTAGQCTEQIVLRLIAFFRIDKQVNTLIRARLDVSAFRETINQLTRVHLESIYIVFESVALRE